MLIKNYTSLLFSFFFIVSLIFLIFPGNGFSLVGGEIGCCDVPGSSDQCIPGQSSPKVFDNQDGCEQSGSGRVWIVDEICVAGGGPPMCEPALGCCVEEPGVCSTTTQSGCPLSDNESWNLATSCDELEICDPPTGCCQTADSCSITTDADCDDTWMANTPCNGNVCATDPVGCCSGIDDPISCDDPITEDNCGDLPGDTTWSEGESCNTEDTCGQLGCCQIQEEEQCLLTIDGTPACSLTNKADCGDGLWLANDMCTESGLCNSLIPPVSAIPTLSQWGLIAMTGLLGLFGLFVIVRRHRYNLS